MGAIVTGFSLAPPTSPSLFRLIENDKRMNSVIGDVRDISSLKAALDKSEADIAVHLAAQPIVRRSYEDPVYTYETNVLGTVNFLECTRKSNRVKSVLNVTTDKVYRNNEWEWAYREDDDLDGFDPYSNSKSCSELITMCYNRSFFRDNGVALSTARAGNVIGGGDFAVNRIIPDCVRAAERRENILVRNPSSVRPYQHVLDALFAYLMIVEAQYNDIEKADAFNIGPDESDCITTANLVELFCDFWGDDLKWVAKEEDGPPEANFLRLDSSRIKKRLGWKPRWKLEKAVEKTVHLAKGYFRGESVLQIMREQIREFMDS